MKYSRKRGAIPRDEKKHTAGNVDNLHCAVLSILFLSPWIFPNASEYRLTPIGIEQSLSSQRALQ